MDKKNSKDNLIKSVSKNSPAYRAGIREGMRLVSVNGTLIKDIFDLHYALDEGENSLVLLLGDEEINLTVFKEIEEEFGVEFQNALLDEYHSCTNKCIFCFIDQMPKGMRDTLYFKDDDTRLSFLQGNYVTLTNVKEEELDRIIGYRLAPINISVHATDPGVRRIMLGNRFAGDIMEKMRRIKQADLPMNGQIVLCKGINDGEVLERTLEDLSTLHPQLVSVSVVPVGLTKHREGLYELSAYTPEDAARVLSYLEKKRAFFRKRFGTGFVYPSDEWYLMAGRGLPGDKLYDGYPQLENGVGMMRLLIEEFKNALLKAPPITLKRRCISVVTGVLAYPIIERLCRIFTKKYPGIRINVYPITNQFFGEQVTVSGLVTGGDIMEQLKNADLGEMLYVPENMLRYHEDVFLDDVSIGDLERALHTVVGIVKSDGNSMVKAFLGIKKR